eukprot:jgi/Botrbrau1/14218/Bobra.0254s0008.1
MPPPELNMCCTQSFPTHKPGFVSRPMARNFKSHPACALPIAPYAVSVSEVAYLI